jgi:hypothetical protein
MRIFWDFPAFALQRFHRIRGIAGETKEKKGFEV